MVPDAHTPCPACPQGVRDYYQLGRRVLAHLQDAPPPIYEEFYVALEALRPWYEAHYADQRHSHSPELEAVRQAWVPVTHLARPLLELVEQLSR